MGAAHQGKVCAIPITFSLSLREFLRHCRRCQQFMRKPGKGRQLLTPRGAATCGHHRTRIPMQHGGGFIQGGDAPKAGSQAGIGRVGHSGLFPVAPGKGGEDAHQG